MSSEIIRAITSDGSVVAYAINSTEIVNEACKIHKPSAVVSAALGRVLSATSMIGVALKGKDDTVTIRFSGDGPAGTILCVSDCMGNVRGYVQNPTVELPKNSKGKLDVSGAIGNTGSLYVIKDLSLKEPYVGQVPIVSGEVAEDINHYLATSEQIPSICALGVLVDTDYSIKAAGGYILQLLPGADEDTIQLLEKNIAEIPPITTMLAEGMTLEQILNKALEGCKVEILDRIDVQYKCDCNRKRVERALISLGKNELEDMSNSKENIEVNCQFCSNKYVFNSGEIEKLAKNKA
jgi:molecular chaperone Hsp33